MEAVKPYPETARRQGEGLSPEQWSAMQPVMAPQLSQSPGGQKAVAAGSTQSYRGVVTEAMMEDSQTDARGNLAAMEAPTFVLSGYDATLQQPNAETYAQTMETSYGAMPNAKLVQVDGRGTSFCMTGR